MLTCAVANMRCRHQAPDSDLDVKVRYANGTVSGYIKYHRLSIGSRQTWERAKRAHELKLLQERWPQNSFCSFPVNGGGRDYGRTTMRPDSDGEVKVKRVSNETTGYINAKTLSAASRSTWAVAVREFWEVNTCVQVGSDTMKLLTAPDASLQVTAAWADTRTSGAFSYDRLKVGKASDWEAGVRAHERAEELKRLRALWPVGSYCSAEKGSVLGLTTTLPSENHSITFRLVGYEDKQNKLPLTKLNKVSKAEWEDANRKFWCAGKIVQSSNGIMKLVTCPNADMAVTATR